MIKIITTLLLLTVSPLTFAVPALLSFNANPSSILAVEMSDGTLSGVAKIDFITLDSDEFWNRTSLDNTVEYNAIIENFFVLDDGSGGGFSTTGQIVILQSPVGTFSISGNPSDDISNLENSISTKAEFNVDPSLGFGINLSLGSINGRGNLDLANTDIPDFDFVQNSFGNKEALIDFIFGPPAPGDYTHQGGLILETVATVSEVPLPTGWLLMVTALALLPKKKR